MLFEDIWKIITDPTLMGYVWQGLWHTIVISFIAVVIGLILGSLVALVKIYAKHSMWMKIPAAICNVYTTVIRGTPVALQLFIMVFAVLAIPGFKIYAVILTFGINSGAYVSENIRAGIMSVDKGQTEAGRALGLTWGKTMVKIVLPQAIKNVIPSIGNEMIALIKETSIISLVGSTIGTFTFDLNAAANEIAHKVVNYLASGIIIGLCYLAIVYVMILLIKLIERRLRQSDKR